MDRKVIVSENQINKMILESTANILRENGYDETKIGQNLGKIGARIKNGWDNLKNKWKTGVQQMKDAYADNRDSNAYRDKDVYASNNGDWVSTYNPRTQRAERIYGDDYEDMVANDEVEEPYEGYRDAVLQDRQYLAKQNNAAANNNGQYGQEEMPAQFGQQDNLGQDAQLGQQAQDDAQQQQAQQPAQQQAQQPTQQQAQQPAQQQQAQQQQNQDPLKDFRKKYGLNKEQKFKSFQSWFDFFSQNKEIFDEYPKIAQSTQQANPMESKNNSSKITITEGELRNFIRQITSNVLENM